MPLPQFHRINMGDNSNNNDNNNSNNNSNNSNNSYSNNTSINNNNNTNNIGDSGNNNSDKLRATQPGQFWIAAAAWKHRGHTKNMRKASTIDYVWQSCH